MDQVYRTKVQYAALPQNDGLPAYKDACKMRYAGGSNQKISIFS